MMHPDTAVAHVAQGVGMGVFATRPIPRGTITWMLDPLDGSWPLEAVTLWPPAYREVVYRTCFRIDSRVVQPWDHARLMNHSCAANCGGTDHGFELALRDIAEGEELTNDYALFALPDDAPFSCRCGAKTCRGDKLFEIDSARVEASRLVFAQALAAIRDVPQPLARLVRPDDHELLLCGRTDASSSAHSQR